MAIVTNTTRNKIKLQGELIPPDVFLVQSKIIDSVPLYTPSTGNFFNTAKLNFRVEWSYISGFPRKEKIYSQVFTTLSGLEVKWWLIINYTEFDTYAIVTCGIASKETTGSNWNERTIDSDFLVTDLTNPSAYMFKYWDCFLAITEGEEDTRIYGVIGGMRFDSNLIPQPRWFTNSDSAHFMFNITPFDIALLTENPWGDDSETGGGDGNFDDSTDVNPLPDIPLWNYLDKGGAKIYKLEGGQLGELYDYLKTGNIVEILTKLWFDPIDSMINLCWLPVETTGEPDIIEIFNVNTNVNARKVLTNYIKIDCGSINIEPYWGGFPDYSPYTELEIYLPYIGINKIDIDVVMSKSIQVVYYVDILSGIANCQIQVTDKNGNSNVLYNFSCDMSIKLPLTGRSYTDILLNIASLAGSTALTYATGGMSNLAQGAGIVGGGAMSVLGNKPHIQKSGALGSNVGIMGIQHPYLIITRCIQQRPKDFNMYYGYMTNVTYTLGDLEGLGFTKVNEIHIQNINATDTEIAMIENLLKSGVLL